MSAHKYLGFARTVHEVKWPHLQDSLRLPCVLYMHVRRIIRFRVDQCLKQISLTFVYVVMALMAKLL